MTLSDRTPHEIAKGLSRAQQRAMMAATFSESRGPWHPQGWYVAADKRVRYNLCRKGLLVDYLRRSNRLVPLGLAVRAVLEGENTCES